MLVRYAELARSEYVYLNLAFKFIVMLAPNCLDNRSVRLEVRCGERVEYGNDAFKSYNLRPFHHRS